jgi:hypothetical protein
MKSDAPHEGESAAVVQPVEAAPTPVETFALPSFSPPFTKTAKPGDGAWTPLRETGLLRSRVHAHAWKPEVEVTLVAADLRRVELGFVAGTQEPKSAQITPDRRPGLVPEAALPELIAVFNGGFMARHGQYGMRIGADRFLAPRADSCTIARYEDSSLRIAPWKELAPSEPTMAWYRQTPPCLLEHSRLNEWLETRPKLWGGAENGDKEIRRSAIGLDRDGRTLFYAHGEWTTAKALADGLAAAGVAHAAELDINWSYTRFVVYGAPAVAGEPPPVVDTLVPKTKFSRLAYVSKPSDRDFFYLARSPKR